MPLVEISVKKEAFTAEELEKFGKDVMDQVVKTYKELKGKEPAHVWVTFRELAGVKIK